MLPLKILPWKPLGSWGLLSTSLLFIILAWSETLVAQSCPTLCDPIDCSPTGFSTYGILQATILEQVVIPHSRVSSHPKDWIKLSFLQADSLSSELQGKSYPCFSSVQFSRSVMSDSLWPHGLQYARPPCPSPTPGVYSNSCPLIRWYHPTISSSLIPFSSCLQSLPASGSSQMSQFFIWGGQSIGVSASVSVLPRNIQDWFPLGWTDWSPCSPRDSQESSPTSQFKTINSSELSFLYSPTLTSIHDYWKNHSLD